MHTVLYYCTKKGFEIWEPNENYLEYDSRPTQFTSQCGFRSNRKLLYVYIYSSVFTVQYEYSAVLVTNFPAGIFQLYNQVFFVFVFFVVPLCADAADQGANALTCWVTTVPVPVAVYPGCCHLLTGVSYAPTKLN